LLYAVTMRKGVESGFKRQVQYRKKV